MEINDINLFGNESIKRLMDIGIALTAEKDYNKLLEKILTEARNITNADGGTLYIIEENKLYHKIMQTKSMNIYKGGNGEKIDFQPVIMNPSNVSAYAAITKKTINIPDVYHSDVFDFSGPKKFDEATGYITKSMLVIPLISRDDKVIGVLQLINSMSEEAKPVPFYGEIEKIVESLASQAGIAIENMQYVEEIKQFFESFVQVMATAIDERTPYNASHSKNIAYLIEKFANHINSIETGKYKDVVFDSKKTNELVTAAWLHDIGKIAVPIEILDKPTRLGDTLENLLLRLDLIEAKLNINYLEKKLISKKFIGENNEIHEIHAEKNEINNEDFEKVENNWKKDVDYIKEAKDLVLKINSPTAFIDEETLIKIRNLKNKSFEGIPIEILSDADYENLTIIKGTLTDCERKAIENHVSVTERILSKMNFPDYLTNVPSWAVKHHEFLDGSGYGKGCKENELPLEVRMLTILDIFDALTAVDRPYKPGMPKEKAFKILECMADEGKLDRELVDIFADSEIWK